MIFRVLLKFDNCIVIMDHMCVGRVILIWMLVSVTFCFAHDDLEIYYFKIYHLQCLGFNQFFGLC
jgi:hypothetical protein